MKQSNGKLPSLEELVNDFQRNYGRGKLKTCLACDSPHRDLIEILMHADHGGPSISQFLRERLGEQISEAVLARHKRLHLNAEAEAEKR